MHDNTRRRFARTMMRGPLIIGLNAINGSWVTADQEIGDSTLARVPHLHGTLSLDETTRSEYAQDYGGIIHERPLAVLRTDSVSDIRRMIDFARSSRLRIAARGQGHQPWGQAQVSSGIVIDMRPMHAVQSVLSDRIDVDAGADWRTVLQASLRRGLAPPVLPAYLGLTVGGTLSIGGIGVATFRHGSQADNVEELEAITGTGDVVTCSEKRNGQLFRAALAGQGQCAVIRRAVVRLTPAPAMIREYTFPYRDVFSLLRDQTALIDDARFDGLVALAAPSNGQWSWALMATRGITPPDRITDAALLNGLQYIAGSERTRDVPYAEYADAIPNVEFGPSRPDLGLLIPGTKAAAFLSEVLPRLTPEDLGAAAGIRVFSWKRLSFTRPLFRIPDEERLVYMAMLRVETDDPAVAARMLAGNRFLFERNRSLGGALYPFSALQLSHDEWKQHYGDAWEALVVAKTRYDPHNLFASGPDVPLTL